MINYNLCQTNTDKFIGGVLENNTVGHNYQLLYKNFINKNVNSIMEIGTANGGFAKFIRDNNLNCFLVGCDINPNGAHQHVQDTTNYNHLYNDFYQGSCFSIDFINWLKNKNYKFDLIIEDANHFVETQSFLINHADELITNNGVYICEDAQSYENAKKVIKCVPNNLKKYSYIWEGIDSIGRYDDICVVIDTRIL